MKNDSFLRYVENTRDCEPARLDAAVNRGLYRAKNARVDSGKFDTRKLALLAAACAFTAVMCFSVNLRPFQSAAKDYYRARNEMLPGASEALDSYIKEMASNPVLLKLPRSFSF